MSWWTIRIRARGSKVIGAGGCGGNAVNHMIQAGLRNVDFIAVNTDSQALREQQRADAHADRRECSRADAAPAAILKSGARPRWRTRSACARCCPTPRWCSSPPGWAAAPAPARRRSSRASRARLGALTVGVVTKPFQFEGRKPDGAGRRRAARAEGRGRYADHDSQPAPALGREPQHVAARGLPARPTTCCCRRCAESRSWSPCMG